MAGLLLATTGCQSQKPLSANSVINRQEITPQTFSENDAYGGYIKAGIRASQDCEQFLNRVNFTEAYKVKLRECAAPALKNLFDSANKTYSRNFHPTDPFLPREGFDGLVVLNKAITFEAENAVKNQNWDKCAQLLKKTTKIALDFSNGDATDLSLGVSLADSAREVIAPKILQMPAGIQSELSKSLNNLLTKGPSIRIAIENEGENFNQGLQFILDCRIKNDYDLLHQTLYKAAQPAINYLQKLSPEEEAEYFKGFRNEADLIVRHYIKEADKPTVERTELKFDKRSERPWKKFSDQFFSTIPPMMSIYDGFIAKTRLLTITTFAMARAKSTQVAPLKFTGLDPENIIDPYSGRVFPYRAAGSEFQVYSVGKDGRDDGGTDESDLLLEFEVLN